MKILVVHPGLQYAHQLAWALNEAELLQGFWSGIPVQSIGATIGKWLPFQWTRKLKRADIPASICIHPFWFPLLYRSTRWLPDRLEPGDLAHRIDHWFDDKWAAPRISKERPGAVVAYENSARATFLAAKAVGSLCILDAASFHHATGSRLSPSTSSPYLPEINRRKDEEVALADLILTCSPLAAESYLAAGVPASKLCPIPLGATLPNIHMTWVKHDAPLHFVFAGALSRRKSIDLIMDAFAALHALGLPYRLSFVGGEAEPGWIQKILQTPCATYIPSMAQSDLFAFFGEADCLLLPSRYDSFGMVVAEAMACGMPAIVSTNTGAKVMIESVPESGWIVECTAIGLLQCLRARIEDRESLFQARPHARSVAQQFTWQAYRRRVSNAITQWLESI